MRASLCTGLLVAVLGTCSAIRLNAAREDEEIAPDWAKAPIVWIHTPKAGSTFGNTLYHHKGLCPTFPDDAWNLPPQWDSDHGFLAEYNIHEHCPNQFSKEYAAPPGSFGVGEVWENNHDHVMAFFRQPEARLISGFKHKWHDWPHKPHKTNFILEHGKSVLGYASLMEGCQVRMLTKGGKACTPIVDKNGTATKPTDEEVQLAIARMKQMKFIGLTDEWDFSICLFHKMYGGECHTEEFKNSRPASAHEHQGKHGEGKFVVLPEDLDLKGYKDEYDGALYEAARTRFFSMMKEHNVDRASCEKTCKAATQRPFSLKKESTGESSLLELGDLYKYDWPGRLSYNED